MSFRRHVAAVSALLLLTAIGGCAWPGGARGRERTVLRFDWPVGLTAFVQSERSTRTTGAGGPASSTFRISYRLDVEQAENGRRVRYGEIRAEDPGSGRIYPMDDLPEPLASQLIAQFPSYVVSDEGRVVQVEDAEALIEESRRKLESRLEELPFPSAAVRERMLASVSEEGLLAAASEHWQRLAGDWSGLTLVEGETYQREGQLTVARLGIRIRSMVEYGLGQRIPCSEEPDAADCVEIEVRSAPLPEALAQLEQAMRERARTATPGNFGVLDDLEIEESSYLITEPATLIPHYLETTTKFRATIVRPGEAERVIAELDQSVYRYSYPRP